jgi:hypothetical protein
LLSCHHTFLVLIHHVHLAMSIRFACSRLLTRPCTFDAVALRALQCTCSTCSVCPGLQLMGDTRIDDLNGTVHHIRWSETSAPERPFLSGRIVCCMCTVHGSCAHCMQSAQSYKASCVKPAIERMRNVCLCWFPCRRQTTSTTRGKICSQQCSLCSRSSLQRLLGWLS